jgi:hypothetical protein
MTVCNNIIKNIQGFMKVNGFNKIKRCFYRIDGDIAFCVELEVPSGLVYVNCYIIPLYVPAEYRYYTYGTRFAIKLPTIEISDNNICLFSDPIVCQLSDSIFPLFKEIATPGVFLEQVRKRQLFGPNNCHISDVQVRRLQLFTALYEGKYANISSICTRYESALTRTTGITLGIKNKHFEEIQCVKSFVAMGEGEIKRYIKSTVDETKLKCFGLK